MQRTKWWLLWWLLLYLVSHNISVVGRRCRSYHKQQKKGPTYCCKSNPTGSDLDFCMKDLSNTLKRGRIKNITETLMDLEDLLEEVDVDDNVNMAYPHLVFHLQKPNGVFNGMTIQASENEASPNSNIPNAIVNVQLPKELDAGPDNTIAFCRLTWPETNMATSGASNQLYNNTMVGLNVRHKNISGLRERVNITMILNIGINETRVPSCVFYDVTTNEYNSSGCLTLWKRGQDNITCSCDHLTYFGVLMVSAPLSDKDQEILTYISWIGCTLSLIALVVTVLIFITNRKIREDVSMKIHVNLAVALILLNIHFLPSHTVAAQSSTGLCLYMALFLHYSLLATFSWMALEGFHIYLLIVKVFNIYIKKYMLKLALVGWGIPAIIVSLVVIIDRDAYGRFTLDKSNPNNTAICYITNKIVKVVTTMGVFGLVFIFNMIMFGLTVRRVVSLHHSKESTCGTCPQGLETGLC
ncbi:adhesion G-protein coupled receptor G1 isoform X2 [Hippoglossus stenolepis]|uniref:adhesion G-protein coupled receptor G1 isoform X2 n=1 Tax=Hippoglossus stenolepis TaxID=195615 RepID=UPI00159C7A24|nr:adhesion G-protein coupled receptor G1 isoform X2 [Hippoglossus stenolepis]